MQKDPSFSNVHTNDNLKKVGLIFFFILGLGHLLSGLMAEKKYFLPLSSTVNEVLFIPFAMSGLIYAFTNLYEKIKPEHRKIATNIFIVVAVLVFVGLLSINIFIPDKP